LEIVLLVASFGIAPGWPAHIYSRSKNNRSDILCYVPVFSPNTVIWASVFSI